VTYLNFETKLVHESPEIGNQNRVYVQVHNRGPLAAHNVTVKVMAAGASGGLPDLPADFWATWPNSAGDANWTPVGSPQNIATLEPLRPTVLEWTPLSAPTPLHAGGRRQSFRSDPHAAKVNDIASGTGDSGSGKNLHLVNPRMCSCRYRCTRHPDSPSCANAAAVVRPSDWAYDAVLRSAAF
jgi:hypothetical protein